MNKLIKPKGAIFQMELSGSASSEFIERLNKLLDNEGSKEELKTKTDWQMVVNIRGGMSNLITPMPPVPGPPGIPAPSVNVTITVTSL